MSTLTIISGPSGAGKTTLADKLANKPNIKIYHYDNLSLAHHPVYMNQVHLKMYSDICEDLNNGYDIVCDDLHTTVKRRRDILSHVRQIDCFKRIMVLNTPLHECLRRNAMKSRPLPDWMIRKFYAEYEPPSLDEGWDEIIYM